MRVSVVMSVLNGAGALAESIESVLVQTFRDFEFIIVDDGSTDETAQVLAAYVSQDSRIRVLRQENRGLTAALNVGCSAASSPLIARQDVGDRSLPQRLEKQVALLDGDERIVAVGCGARRIGPAGEFLGDFSRELPPETISGMLRSEGVGLLHAASMFRKDAFERAGGYRSEFRFAQDTDLWYRLVEYGLLAECAEILFELRVEISGISGQKIKQQIRLADVARRCYHARLAGHSEADLLKEALAISESGISVAKGERQRRAAEAAYFIGSQLYEQGDARCRPYLREAMAVTNRLPAALAKYALSLVRCTTATQSDNRV